MLWPICARVRCFLTSKEKVYDLHVAVRIGCASNTVNQIEYAYDGWGNLVTEKQEHDGAVDGSTLSVQYTYDDGASAIPGTPY